MELPGGRVLSWSELGADASENVLVHDHGTGRARGYPDGAGLGEGGWGGGGRDSLELFDPCGAPGLAPADVEAFAAPAYAEGAMATLAEATRQGKLGAAGDQWAFVRSWGFEI